MHHKAIFLDRDGVLNYAIIKNGNPYPPQTLSEVIIPSDAKLALQTLKSAGFLLIGATNQLVVERKITTREFVEVINAKIMLELPLDEIYVCYHDEQNQCLCRKPLPGLLVDAAKKYGINLKKSIMIGDRWKDIEASQRAGCQTIWIKQLYQEKEPAQYDFMALSLTEATEWILNKRI